MIVTDQMISKVAERLRALADENRIRILLRLKNSPANVSTLTSELGIAQASVSKHLAILRQVGILEVQRQGTQAIYRVRDESIFGLCEIVCAGVIEFVNDQHAALSGQTSEMSQS